VTWHVFVGAGAVCGDADCGKPAGDPVHEPPANDNAPKTLEEVEAVAALPKPMAHEAASDYLKRSAAALGHIKREPYTPETARLARKVLTAPDVDRRIDAIFRGEFDHVKLGEREPGSEG
jgi:hypothetical protein